MKKIEILGLAITATDGTLSTGQKLTVSDEFAAHLVEECKVAKYLEEPASVEVAEVVEKPTKPRKTPKAAFDEAEAAQVESTDKVNDVQADTDSEG